MECFWCLYSHWQPDGNRYQQDPPVFYVHIPADIGFSYYYLFGAGFLEKHEEIYLGGEAEPLVLSIKKMPAGFEQQAIHLVISGDQITLVLVPVLTLK